MKIITFVSALLLCSGAFGQAAQFWNNYTFFNPSMTGLRYKHEGNIATMSQINDSPFKNSGYFANYGARIKRLHGGVGVNYFRSSTFSSKTDYFNLNYSYHINLGEQTVLALGASAGMFDSRVLSYYNFPDLTSYTTERASEFTTNAGISLRYKSLTAGVGVRNLNQSWITDSKGNSYRSERTFNVFADHNWSVSDNFALATSALAQTDMRGNFYSQLSARAVIKGKYSAGAHVSNDMYGLSLGYEFDNRFNVGYSVNKYKYSPIRYALHEITLGIRIK